MRFSATVAGLGLAIASTANATPHAIKNAWLQDVTIQAVSESVVVKLIATIIIGIMIPPALKFAKWAISGSTWSSMATRKGLRFKRVSDIYSRLIRITDDEFDVIQLIYNNGGLEIVDHMNPSVQSLLASGLLTDDMADYDNKVNHAIRLDKCILNLDLNVDPVTSNPMLDYPPCDKDVKYDIKYSYIYSPWAVSKLILPFTRSGNLLLSSKRFIVLAVISMLTPFILVSLMVLNGFSLISSMGILISKGDYYSYPSPLTTSTILVSFIMVSISPLKTIIALIRNNVAMAPFMWTSFSTRSYVLVRSSDRLSYMPVTYHATCMLCQGDIEIIGYRKRRGSDILLGTCVNNPRLHRYTFDHVTMGGNLRENRDVLLNKLPDPIPSKKRNEGV